MLELAKCLYEREQARVHLFALEHRYYGESYPEFKDKNGNATSPVTNENLIFLSSRQALADIAHFINTMNDAHDLHNNKWITFGGSYPGMMAAWARLEYPKLVHAAVSNSAPIEMKLDFGAYNERVAYDLQYPLVGGSAACLQVVMDGHQDIVNAIANGYNKEIASLFHVCDEDSLLHRKNVEMFVGDGVINIPAQGNDPHCDAKLCNIQKVRKTDSSANTCSYT
jgi:pimeloyl-ACP methyl ester carboxylesterase